MLCRKCDRSIISTKDVRTAACHYVGVDPTVWQRLCAEPSNLPMIFETMVQAGKISCEGCRNDCGIVIRYRNTYLPALKIGEFSLRRVGENGPRLFKKKWTQMQEYIVVDDLADSDIRDMHDALDKTSVAALENRIRIVEQMGALFGNDQSEE